jgi:hypothetical protein
MRTVLKRCAALAALCSGPLLATCARAHAGAVDSAGACSPSSTDGGVCDAKELFADVRGDDPIAPTGCTPDLTKTVDAKGNILESCPPDLACAKGKCVPACEAMEETKGSVGCDYLVSTPEGNGSLPSPCLAAFVANSWQKAVKISVSRGGITYDVTQFGRIPVAGRPATAWDPIPSSGLPVGKIAVLFLSSDPNANLFSEDGGPPRNPPGKPMTCPIAPAVTGSTVVPGSGAWRDVSGRGEAFDVRTDYPVTIHDILPYGGATTYLTGATLLYPTTAWGTSYFGIVPPRGDFVARGGIAGGQFAQLVAAADGTTVTVSPTVDLPGGVGVDRAVRGTPRIYALNRGEFLQWQDTNEMSGTLISSDKPIAVIGGHGQAIYPPQGFPGTNGDSIHQAIPPISAFSNEYAVAEYAPRPKDHHHEVIPYRIVGAADGTTLSYDPGGLGGGAGPATINSGQVVDFASTSSFVVRSQDLAHAFYVGQVMTGGDDTGCENWNGQDSGTRGSCYLLGDPEFVNVIPAAQFLSRYAFFTDPTYATTNLVFVRAKGAGGFHDVTLDCVGALTGWTKIGYDDKYETTNVDLLRDSVRNGACDNGPHTASSEAPFGLTVWGLDMAVSYAYPAGGRLAPINPIVIPPR